MEHSRQRRLLADSVGGRQVSGTTRDHQELAGAGGGGGAGGPAAGGPADANPFDVHSGFPEQTTVEASATLQSRVASNGFNRLTSKCAKSAPLRVTIVSL